MLERAIEFDEGFALAYATAAQMYTAGIRTMSVDESRDRARQYAEKALDLDPKLGLAHAVLAELLTPTDWEAARRGYEQALNLNPNDTEVLRPFWMFYLFSGQFAEATPLARRLAELDPGQGTSHLAYSLHFAGDNEEARALLMNSTVEHPESPVVNRLTLGTIEVALGNYSAALEQTSLGQQLWGDTPPVEGIISETSYVYARAGSLSDAERLYARIEEPTDWEVALWRLGVRDRAGAFVGSVPRRIHPNLGRMVWNSWNDPMLEELEFLEVRSRLGFRD